MAAFMLTRNTPLVLLLVGGVAVAGCGGDSGGGTPPSTTAIAKITGDGQAGRVGETLVDPIEVQVTDGGAPAVGVTVAWSTTSGGSLDPVSVTTDAAGHASSSWTLGTTSGAQTAQAALSGATGSPVSFTASAQPDAPVALTKAGGDQQNGSLNSPLPQPVQAKVADQFGNGVAEVVVGWTASGGTVSSATVPSNTSGISAVNVTAGAAEGPITIVATAEGLTGSPLTFTATATTAPIIANVTVANNSFTPAALTVSAGTTVVWTWQASATNHNVHPVAAEPTGSGNPTDGPHTYQYKFNTPGTFIYYCEVHGSPTGGMRGTITVQ
jgi:plastocyanin